MSEEDTLITIPVSAGELIDKLTILQIKRERITDPAKLANIRRELELLEGIRGAAPRLAGIDRAACDELLEVNQLLWKVEDDIRDCERRRDFGSGFIDLARSVYRLNDRRAQLKSLISQQAGSALLEEKSYHAY